MKFSISGDYVTNHARDMYFLDRVEYKEAADFLSNYLGGLDMTKTKLDEIIKSILEGRKKLVGLNSFELVDDNENIRVISPISVALHKKEIIDSITHDVFYHADKYIDFYAMDKSWLFFIGNTPIQAYQYAYTDMVDIARLVSCVGVDTVECIPHVREPLNLEQYFDDSNKDLLDHGAYITQNPMLVYDLIGEPLSAANRTYFYERLYEYWEQSEHKNNPSVRRRQQRYLNSVKRKKKFIDDRFEAKDDLKKVEKISTAFKSTYDDEFTSEFGIIDLDGHWYNCDWACHSLKAKTVLESKGIVDNTASLDYCLDKVLELGYVLIRDVERFGQPYVYGKPNNYQRQTIDSYCNFYGIDSIEYKTAVG